MSYPVSGMPVRRIGLFGNPAKAELPPTVETIQRVCAATGVRLVASSDLAEVLPAGIPFVPNEQLAEAVDVIIALGGDGTMLRAARVLALSGVPLLGVNLGSLGYLTDVPLNELQTAMDALISGDYHLDRRSRVYCRVQREGQPNTLTSALNDLVVNMGPLPRALEMELILDGDSLGPFLGDGVIVSTPTGSTAYNLSAGGPICHSAVPCLIVSPICPHSLGMRPLIISGDTTVELRLHETGEGAVLTADGQKTQTLENGDRLIFSEADDEVALVKFAHSTFYRVMRHKLNWGGPNRRGRRRV
ncbi:NAD(+) kinase [bacterium DOLJORAL78_65_58]|nr:MAG: NAD(+) kinase [bacterium DOLZORAL124_64_63]PIE76161.1 MAG: NAD(+) kinase [bacterium DOLJORAL78_65_58]